MLPKLKWQAQGPRFRKKFKVKTKNEDKVVDNTDSVYFAAWPKEKHTGTAAVKQLLQPSKDQKFLPPGEEQAEEMY